MKIKFLLMFTSLALVASLLLANPAAAEPEAPPRETESAPSALPDDAVQVVAARGQAREVCGWRKARLSFWEVTGAQGFEVVGWFGWPDKAQYLLRVNTVFAFCNYVKRRVQDKVLPRWNQYCVTLLENWESRVMRGVDFSGWLSAKGQRARDVVDTYVSARNLDNRGDTACARAGLSYLPRKALARDPAMQIVGVVDLENRPDKVVKVDRGRLRGIPLSPKIGARVG